MKKSIILFLLCVVLSFLAGNAESQDAVLKEEGYLLRGKRGEGVYEAELLLEVEGLETERNFKVTVPERRLTQKEEAALLEAAVSEAETLFFGENTKKNQAEKRVIIQKSYQRGQVQAEWEFSHFGLIDEDGRIREELLKEEKEEVLARVLLTCEDSSVIHEFYFIVCKQKKGEEERIYEEIAARISKNSMAEGTEKLLLPLEAAGRTLVWKNKKSDTPVQILFLGVLMAVLLPAAEKQKKEEKQKKREEELLREYPEVVNKLALLTGAGMTVYAAWKKITEMYLNARETGKIRSKPVYEEMLVTRREIESGMGERKAYAAFGERCKVPKYRKLSTYLVQNLKKGSRGMQAILEKEASEVFEERKGNAKRYGEEAGTRLLLPMLLMLGIVVFIIMVPAVISFQSGI